MTLYPDSDCCRDSCCPGYTLVVGRCIPDTEDPCRLFFCYAISSTLYIGQSHITWIICFFLSPEYGLCEQQCSTYFGRVICTCFAGYNFNKVILWILIHHIIDWCNCAPLCHPVHFQSHWLWSNWFSDPFEPRNQPHHHYNNCMIVILCLMWFFRPAWAWASAPPARTRTSVRRRTGVANMWDDNDQIIQGQQWLR